MSTPYHPDTDAVPDMTDHRVADLRARLAAAEAREARLVRVLSMPGILAPMKWADERRAALTTDGSALAQAIEGVLRSFPQSMHGPLSDSIDVLRRAWGQR